MLNKRQELQARTTTTTYCRALCHITRTMPVDRDADSRDGGQSEDYIDDKRKGLLNQYRHVSTMDIECF